MLPRQACRICTEPFALLINEKSLHHHQKGGMKTLIDLRYCKQLRFEIVKWCAQVTFTVTWNNDNYLFARTQVFSYLKRRKHSST